MIFFIEKTWFLWWVLLTIVALRWFHLSVGSEMKDPEPDAEEEEQAYLASWRILHNAQAVSLSETSSAY
jgi:hypothetical protein